MIFKLRSLRSVWLVLLTFIVIIFVGSAFLLPSSVLSHSLNSENSTDNISVNTPVYQIHIPNKVSFAGEKVPIYNYDTRESLEREMFVNTYWHSQTVLLLKRANRYFPIIEPILKEMGVPDDFKYLAVAESALTHAVSPARAVGFWQILQGTGQDLGLEINDEVDERYHIEKSTYAACKYLTRGYNLYGNWTMAAAAYNMGRTAINRQITRQANSNYYDMIFGEETERYVFRIVAFKLIYENPELYGFHFKSDDLYPPVKYYEVKVDSSVTSLAQFAEHHHVNYKMLKMLNPWLRRSFLTNRQGREYIIKIHEPGFRESAYDVY